MNAYGIFQGMTFPLIFKVFKPKKRLKKEDKYKSKPQLAIEIIEALQDLGFNFELVLADSLYGESSEFINALDKYNLKYIVAIRKKREARCPRLLKFRSNHGVLMPPGGRVRYTRWKKFERVFSLINLRKDLLER